MSVITKTNSYQLSPKDTLKTQCASLTTTRNTSSTKKTRITKTMTKKITITTAAAAMNHAKKQPPITLSTTTSQITKQHLPPCQLKSQVKALITTRRIICHPTSSECPILNASSTERVNERHPLTRHFNNLLPLCRPASSLPACLPTSSFQPTD